MQPSLAVYAEQDSVRIRALYEDGAKAAVLRSENDGEFEIITLLESSHEYVDSTVKSGVEYKYKIRAYSEGYSDSVTRTVLFEYGGIYLQAEGISLHMEVAEDVYLQHTETWEQDMVLVNYSGRTLPVVERGEHRVKNIQKKAYVTFEQKKVFEDICSAEQTFYRDGNGNAFACAVSGVQFTRYRDSGYHVTFEVTEVGKEEVVINV